MDRLARRSDIDVGRSKALTIPQENLDQIFHIFVGVWILIGIAFSAFLFFNRNAALKRKLVPPLVIGTAVLFLGFVWMVGFPLYTAPPAVALITYSNIRTTKFCDACGRTAIPSNPIFAPKFCSKCGANLA